MPGERVLFGWVEILVEPGDHEAGLVEFSAEQQRKMGVTEDMVRVAVGIEDIEDIKADFEQAIERAFKETK